MQDVVRKRLVGAAVLIALGIVVPLLLARWLHDPAADGQGMRVYEINPSGSVELVEDANDDGAATAGDSAVDKQQADSGQLPELQPGADVALADNEHTPTLPESQPQQADGSDASASEPTESAQRAGEPEPSAEQDQSDAAVPQPGEAEAETPAADTEPKQTETTDAPTEQASESQQAGTAAQSQQASAEGDDRSVRRKASSGDWIVQVASFGKEKNAQALAQELGKDFSAFYAAAEVNGDTWYRVRIGPLDSEAAADNVASELHAQGHNTLVLQID